MTVRPMAIFRRSKKKSTPRRSESADRAGLAASLQICLEKIAELERANDTHIKRMAAMQAEIDHLRAILGRNT